ncbi:hypothetical protein OQA88_11824 [Cercophora sp. LCS_1]
MSVESLVKELERQIKEVQNHLQSWREKWERGWREKWEREERERERQKQRALREIHGFIAALDHLDRTDRDFKSPSLGSLSKSHADFLGIPLEEEVDGQDGPNSSSPTTSARKAWKALRAVRRGIVAEFQKFQEVASQSESPTLCDLRAFFPSHKTLAHRGLLIFRDVVNGIQPSTLVETFAFATLSHAVSQVLIRQKRMQSDQLLLGLLRWRDCIRDESGREAFETLADSLWPVCFQAAKHAESLWSNTLGMPFAPSPSTPAEGGPAPWQVPDPTGPEGVRTPTDPVFGGQPPHDALVVDEPWRVGGIATVPTSPTRHGPCSTTEPPTLLGDTLHITDATSQEFNFAQFIDLGVAGWEQDIRSDFDPMADSFDTQPWVPDTNPSVYNPIIEDLPPPDIPHLAAERMATEPPTVPSTLQHPVPLVDASDSCLVAILKATFVFIAVVIFTNSIGDYLTRLSCEGISSAWTRAGSAFAVDRSKVERKLRREFFQPLKHAGGEDEFLALLGVAKTMVVLGFLATLEEVQNYLHRLSKELLLSDAKQAAFARWMYQTPRQRPAEMGLSLKRRDPPDTEAEGNRLFLASTPVAARSITLGSRSWYQSAQDSMPIHYEATHLSSLRLGKRVVTADQNDFTSYPGTAPAGYSRRATLIVAEDYDRNLVSFFADHFSTDEGTVHLDAIRSFPTVEDGIHPEDWADICDQDTRVVIRYPVIAPRSAVAESVFKKATGGEGKLTTESAYANWTVERQIETPTQRDQWEHQGLVIIQRSGGRAPTTRDDILAFARLFAINKWIALLNHCRACLAKLRARLYAPGIHRETHNKDDPNAYTPNWAGDWSEWVLERLADWTAGLALHQMEVESNMLALRIDPDNSASFGIVGQQEAQRWHYIRRMLIRYRELYSQTSDSLVSRQSVVYKLLTLMQIHASDCSSGVPVCE